MADDELNEDLDGGEGEDGQDSAVIRELRAKAREADKLRTQAAEADALRRELAFARAGIDTTSKLGAMFAKTFEGDLADIDALKSEAAEMNVPFLNGYEPRTSPTGDTGTGERRTLADGAPADGGVIEDPRGTSLSRAQKAIDEGASFDMAAGHLIHERAIAAMNGDRRVIIEDARR